MSAKCKYFITLSIVIFILHGVYNANLYAEDTNGVIVFKTDSLKNSLNNEFPARDQDYPHCYMDFTPRSKLLKGATPYKIDSLLASPNLYAKLTASAILAKGEILDTLESVEILLSALDNEIKHPFSSEYSHGFVVPNTQIVRGDYTIALINLLGKEKQELLKSYIDKSSGELKNWLILGLGYLGDPEAKANVRLIYLSSSDTYIKLYAMNVISRHPDTLDIPAIEAGLNDSYLQENNHDIPYPIQSTAICAARKLGFAVEKQGDKNVLIKK